MQSRPQTNPSPSPAPTGTASEFSSALRLQTRFSKKSSAELIRELLLLLLLCMSYYETEYCRCDANNTERANHDLGPLHGGSWHLRSERVSAFGRWQVDADLTGWQGQWTNLLIGSSTVTARFRRSPENATGDTGRLVQASSHNYSHRR